MLQERAMTPQPHPQLRQGFRATQAQFQRGEGGERELVPVAADTRDDAKPVALVQLLLSCCQACRRRASDACLGRQLKVEASSAIVTCRERKSFYKATCSSQHHSQAVQGYEDASEVVA